MKSKLPWNLILVCLAVAFAGCGKPPNREVTDGIDRDAIRAYEEAVNAVQAEDTAPISKQKAIAP